jgi:hypothetical protein
MTNVPTAVRDSIRDKLWEQCDDLGWSSLSDQDRANLYEKWTRDPAIGGQLAHLMDARKVRVYIKDSLVKPYVRDRLSLSDADVWRLLGLTADCHVVQTFIKPHGRRLNDGKIVCWGRSRDWKSILMAAFERGQAIKTYSAFGVVLLESGKTDTDRARALVHDAASRLGIQKLAWLE